MGNTSVTRAQLCLNCAVWQPPAPGDRDLIEAHALRRRHVIDAFLHGSRGRGDVVTEPTLRFVVLGVAVAVAIGVVVGLLALVDATRHHQRQAQSVAVSYIYTYSRSLPAGHPHE